MARSAYGAEDKEARRQAILRVAGELFMKGDGELPAASEIAAAAGLAKGTVTSISAPRARSSPPSCSTAGVPCSSSWNGHSVRLLIRRPNGFVDHTLNHAELMRLDALGHGILERNLEPDTLVAFKQALSDRLMAGGALLDRELELAPGRGAQLLTRTYALTRGLWQSFHSAARPAVSTPTPYTQEFGIELRQALTEYWREALTS